jgi:hypothetical protein
MTDVSTNPTDAIGSPLMKIHQPYRRLALAAAALVLAVAAGCGARGADAPTTDPEAARRVLAAALDAWKAGAPGAAGAVAVDGRDVRIADEDWLAGTRLVDYRLVADRDPAAAVARPGTEAVPVRLVLAPARGRKATRTAVYLVATGPSPLIVRQD